MADAGEMPQALAMRLWAEAQDDLVGGRAGCVDGGLLPLGQPPSGASAAVAATVAHAVVSYALVAGLQSGHVPRTEWRACRWCLSGPRAALPPPSGCCHRQRRRVLDVRSGKERGGASAGGRLH